MWSTRSLSSLLLLTALLATGCKQGSDEGPLLASVYGHELHRSDLAGLVGEGVSAKDSAAIVSSYVEQWIRQTVLLAKAEKNITDDFDRQLKEYKNSLLIYAYEQKIVNQLLDTVVTKEQIDDYYEQHKSEFLLKYSVVRSVRVTAPLRSTADAKLRQIVTKHDFRDEDIVELEEVASRHGLQGRYDSDAWMPFYELQNVVPVKTYNEELFLKQNRYIVMHDDSLAYYVRILEYKKAFSESPLSMERENIRAIILNHRKIEILGKMESDLIQEAKKNDNIKRYI